MRLTPREPVIPEDGGFTDANDIFGYREFAENLSNLVQDIDEPLVIVLDGPWGSGKSTFVKQWAGLLRAKDAPVIVFDAFANDHHEDAFLGISAEIHDTAKKVLGSGAGATRRYFDKAKRAGALLAPIGLRVTARVATAGLMSIDDIEAGGEALKEAAKAFGDEGGKALEKAVSERLRSAGRERAILQTFRESLSELARNVSEKRSKTCRTYPLVFFIDELDRCRPPFALSVIERVKHLFSVPGVCFVLVAHVGQLEKIVEGAYGTGFDARTYLEKFYHLMIALPEGTSRQAANRTAYISHLWDALEIRFLLTHTDELVKQQLTDFGVWNG
jgi:energy-coupling factor transporter ATP-binding protein EcfA2